MIGPQPWWKSWNVPWSTRVQSWIGIGGPSVAPNYSPPSVRDAQPLPGYVLLEPLGRGGFGEVWKCEAPGGLHKAVKFVAGDPDSDDGGGDQLRQEFDAFQQIKAIRHPFLLTLERVELIGGEL